MQLQASAQKVVKVMTQKEQKKVKGGTTDEIIITDTTIM